MTDKKITQLTELTSPTDDDLLPIVDSPAGAAETKKVTLSNLKTSIISTHETATDPHAVYQKENEKEQNNGYAGLNSSGQLTGSRLPYGSSANTACQGNDARLSDSRTPLAHTSSHQSGGSDTLKLDDLASPDDNTDLDTSSARHGLCPKLPADSSKYLNGAGSWSVPSGGSGGFTNKVVVRRSSDQTLSTGVWSTIQFNEEIKDSDGLYSTSNFEITIPATGYYDLAIHLNIDTTGRAVSILQKDTGSGYVEWLRFGPIYGENLSSSPYGCSLALNDLPLNNGDKIRVQAYLTGSGLKVKAHSYLTLRRTE